MKTSITQAELKAFLSYEPETGIMRHLTGAWAGRIAGTIDHQGYVIISIKNDRFRRSRLAWLYVTGEWPQDLIDHRNRVRHDDSFANLREATVGQNVKNSGSRRVDKLKGAFWHKRDRRWWSQIYLNAKPVYLGYFDSELEAHAAYCEAAKRLHGEFARTA